MKLHALCFALLALPAVAFAGRQEADLALTQARSAVAAAEREAQRARADGRVAEARACPVKAETATAEIEAAVDTLRAELNRQGGL